MSVKIYGFINDTAFYNRDFDPSSGVNNIDQGACCYSDKVSQMFAEPMFVRDTRDARCTMPTLVKVATGWEETDLRNLITNDHTRLDGAMSFVYDGSKVTSEVKHIFTQTTQMNALFSFLEILGHYQTFEDDLHRTGVDIELASQQAEAYKTAAGNAEVNKDLTEANAYITSGGSSAVEFITHNIKIADDVRTNFTTKRIVRKSVVVSFDGVAEDGTTIPIELHVWWSRDAFYAEYPLSTITDVVFPCEPTCLYELLDNYKSVAAFATASSNYRSTEMDKVVAKNDHTGVYTFETDYHAYPDTQPSNVFQLSFSCVYKGRRPTIEEVKLRLKEEILAILPAHSEGEWRKKLPGIISDRQFYLIPVYDNVWKTHPDGETVTHRWGIYDLTIIPELIRKTLGRDYLDYQSYAQLVAPKFLQYPVMCVPDKENDISSRSIATLYNDYIGIRAGEEDPDEGRIDQEKPFTQDFETHLNDALAIAAGEDTSKFEEKTDFPGMKWVPFTPSDGVSYYVLARVSYPTTIR